MSARIFFPKRVPFNGLAAGKRTPAFARFNSSSSTSRAARVYEMASQAEKPSMSLFSSHPIALFPFLLLVTAPGSMRLPGR
jgi:hypothetical protein